MNIRSAAAKALVPVLQQNANIDASMARFLEECPDKEKGLFKELCYGVCRRYFTLDALSTQLLAKPLKKKDADVYALLLVGLYQLWQMRIPDHAAINETVNASKKLKKLWAKNLVNGVLRRFSRERDELLQQAHKTAHVHHDLPPWLFTSLTAAWPEDWQNICDALAKQAPLSLRVNRSKTTRDQYSQRLHDADIPYHVCQFSDDGITLESPVDVMKLPGFNDGECSVQDEAAQLSIQLLDLQPGQRFLDACCAPGGKLCHALEYEPTLSAVGVDLEEKRLEKVRENLTRLQLSADLCCSDILDTDTWWDDKAFDRILVDAPCSATGVIRRHPDIKLLRRKEDIAALSDLQLKILQKLWSTLAPGGLLVYATCSILPQENENVVKAFLEEQPDATHIAIDSDWGIERPNGRQLFPQDGGHDGFYYAVINKA